MEIRSVARQDAYLILGIGTTARQRGSLLGTDPGDGTVLEHALRRCHYLIDPLVPIAARLFHDFALTCWRDNHPISIMFDITSGKSSLRRFTIGYGPHQAVWNIIVTKPQPTVLVSRSTFHGLRSDPQLLSDGRGVAGRSAGWPDVPVVVANSHPYTSGVGPKPGPNGRLRVENYQATPDYVSDIAMYPYTSGVGQKVGPNYARRVEYYQVPPDYDADVAMHPYTSGIGPTADVPRDRSGAAARCCLTL